MPSKLPIIKANTQQDNIDKMKFIAEHNKRSLSKELELIIEQHIEEFEKEHGEITFYYMSPKEMINKIANKITNKNTEENE